MDESGDSETGRQRSDQYKSVHAQWMMPQNQMKDHHTMKLIALMTERNNAIQERNLAISEKKAALAERDMAIMQRDAAIAERDSAIMERDNALAALELARQNAMNTNGGHGCPPGCTVSRGIKHVHNHNHLSHVQPSPPQLSDAPYDHAREMHIMEAYPISTASESDVKGRKAKRPRKEKKTQAAPLKKTVKAQRKSKKVGGNEQVTIARTHLEWKDQGAFRGGEDLNKVSKQEWKDQDLGLNQVTFDESTMPVPVCSCTGKFQQCYKWGNGGWQSACCTTTLSMYPLPVMPNKRHARMGGRKMSGSVFVRLLSRLAAEGHDLSLPVDLKDHWAKHGTNRYITIK